MNSVHPALVETSANLIRSNVGSSQRRKTYSAVVATEETSYRDVFSLRHASYLDSGFIDPQPGALFSDAFDHLPNSSTIIVYEESRPVASVRVCFLSSQDRNAPVAHAFPAEVEAILSETAPGRAGITAAEITRLVRSPDSANNQGLVFLLYRLAGHLVLRADVQMILSSVRRNHMPFYRRLGFIHVAGPSAYPGLSCPMSLMKCPRSEYDQARNAFPLMNPEAAPPGAFDGFATGTAIAMPLTFV
jgi:hypothetical protein